MVLYCVGRCDRTRFTRCFTDVSLIDRIDSGVAVGAESASVHTLGTCEPFSSERIFSRISDCVVLCCRRSVLLFYLSNDFHLLEICRSTYNRAEVNSVLNGNGGRSMFVLIATIAASVFAADTDAGPKDIYARLGVPKMETCDYRIHVGEDGKWTTHLTQTYSIEGVASEDLNDFAEMIEQATESWAQSFSRSEVGKNRRQCESKGKSDDSLKLASQLVNVFEKDRCDFLRWDRESFEWKFLREDDHPSSRDEKKTVGEFVAGAAFNIFLTVVINEELRQKDVTQADLESAIYELPKSKLVLTTDGKITADSPAEVSEDGKTMTLDLSKFLSDPPEKWSIRIDGL